ncbi:hypothetical protein BGZ89_008349, partial [Linnemannia elongata]
SNKLNRLNSSRPPTPKHMPRTTDIRVLPHIRLLQLVLRTNNKHRRRQHTKHLARDIKLAPLPTQRPQQTDIKQLQQLLTQLLRIPLLRELPATQLLPQVTLLPLELLPIQQQELQQHLPTKPPVLTLLQQVLTQPPPPQAIKQQDTNNQQQDIRQQPRPTSLT